MGVHCNDGNSLSHAVAGLVLAGGGVHTNGHTDNHGQDGGEQEQLRGHPDAVADLFVDHLTDRRLSPIPLRDDVGQPSPPALQKRGFWAEVIGLEEVIDFLI